MVVRVDKFENGYIGVTATAMTATHPDGHKVHRDGHSNESVKN